MDGLWLVIKQQFGIMGEWTSCATQDCWMQVSSACACEHNWSILHHGNVANSVKASAPLGPQAGILLHPVDPLHLTADCMVMHGFMVTADIYDCQCMHVGDFA